MKNFSLYEEQKKEEKLDYIDPQDFDYDFNFGNNFISKNKIKKKIKKFKKNSKYD